MASLEAELSTVVGASPRSKNESRQHYLTRLAMMAGTLTSDRFLLLSPAAQAWINAARKLHNERKPVPEPETNGVQKVDLHRQSFSELTEGADIKECIKILMLRDPGIKNTMILSVLRDAGRTTSANTVAHIASDFRHTLKLLRNFGVLAS